MTLLHLAASGPSALARWETILSLLAAIIVLLGLVWRAGRRVILSIDAQVSSTRLNTEAIVTLTRRVETLEQELHRP